MAIPQFDEFLYPFLAQLKDHDVSTKDMKSYLFNHFGLADEDKNILTRKGSASQFDDRVGWARQYLRRAGFLVIPQRGVYRITQRGLDFLKTHTSLTVNDLAKYPEFTSFYHTVKGNDSDKCDDTKGYDKIVNNNDTTPTEQLENAFQSIQDDLAAEILDKTLKQSPESFEHIVMDLLLKMGYGNPADNSAKVTQYSHDGGIDGIIPQDKLGLDKIYFQAKRYGVTNVVQKPEVQAFSGALDGQMANKGVFITTSSFSKGAREFAQITSKKIVLIDGKQLARYMIEFNVGVSTDKVYVVKKIDNDYFDE